MNAKSLLLFIGVLIFLFSTSFALKPIDTLKHKPHFEVSFGQSILYISNSRLATLRNQASIIVPTNSALFFVEYRPNKKLRVPVFLNLPTESKQYLVNGQIINERASPTLGTGLQFRMITKKIDDRSRLEFEMGPLVSFIADKKDRIRVAPILAGRIRLIRGENFVMYAGCSYSLGINALGLLYGTGTVF